MNTLCAKIFDNSTGMKIVRIPVCIRVFSNL